MIHCQVIYLSAQLLPGTIVDNRYKVEAVIGEGGMGVVYRVFDLDLNRVAALKMLHAGSLEGNASKRFRREASTLAKLDHKSLVEIYSTGYVEQSYYVCMEYVEGTSLRHLLNTSKRLPWRFVVNLCRQICAGLACAHARGIVHRDLTSNNVLVVSESETEPQVKIIDFGLCTGETSATTVDQRLTQTGVVVGSLHYMSPEQYSCEGGEISSASTKSHYRRPLVCGATPVRANTGSHATGWKHGPPARV